MRPRPRESASLRGRRVIQFDPHVAELSRTQCTLKVIITFVHCTEPIRTSNPDILQLRRLKSGDIGFCCPSGPHVSPGLDQALTGTEAMLTNFTPAPIHSPLSSLSPEVCHGRAGFPSR